MPLKKIAYINNAAEKEVQKLPPEVATDFLSDIKFVAAGKDPRGLFAPLKSIGPGVIELKENGSPAYRLVYCAKHEDTVYILCAFTKTTNGVDRKAMVLVEKRYKEMMAMVREAAKASKK